MIKRHLWLLFAPSMLFGQLAVEPTAQPTNLVFSPVGFDSLVLNFTASIGGADGYLVLKTQGSSPPTGVPTDGTQYLIGQWLVDGAVWHYGPATRVTDSELDVNASYAYSIFAYNGSGDGQINYLTTAPLSGAASTLIDTVDPVIDAVSVWPYPASYPGHVVVSARIRDNHRRWTTQMGYRTGLETSFAHTVGGWTAHGDTVSFNIPESGITPSGVFYRIETSDFSGNTSTYTGTIPVFLSGGHVSTAAPEGGAYPFGFPVNKWHMISVPLKLDSRSVSNVLSDLEEPGNSTWRLFDGSYEVSTTAQFTLGKSFWLKQVHLPGGKQITLGAGTTASAADGRITLTPGWNQIGNPFTFPVDWALHTDAADNVNIKGPIAYDGSKYVGIGQTSGDNTPFTELKPWDGYWVYNASSTNQILTIDPSGNLELGKLFKPSFAVAGWRVQFIVKNGQFEDQFNYVGVASDATNEADRYDLPELPTIGDYVSVAFDHLVSGKMMPYTIDYQLSGEEGYTWDMTVTTNLSGENTLTWTPEGVPSGYVIRLMNVTDHELVEGDGYRFRSEARNRAVRFKVWIGTEEFVSGAMAQFESELPREFALHQNYPNPFNPGTTIRFDMPRAAQVKIKVYNLLGQEVATLADKYLETGRHEVRWNGRDALGRQVSSGVYIYRMETKEFTRSRKMLMVK